MTPFQEADARLGAMHGYAPMQTPCDEWELPLAAQGRVRVLAVKGSLPPVEWDD